MMPSATMIAIAIALLLCGCSASMPAAMPPKRRPSGWIAGKLHLTFVCVAATGCDPENSVVMARNLGWPGDGHNP